MFLPPPALALPQAPQVALVAPAVSAGAPPHVPFYSQFSDISSATWKKQGCGIASLAMVIGYYTQDSISVDALLKEGIKAGAYSNAGWTYDGLIQVAQKHGMTGTAYSLGGKSTADALAAFKSSLAAGPVIASVHYKFQPTNPIPHLVVITAIEGDTVYYNDPAAKSGELHIPLATFLGAWKKRFIVIRPIHAKLALS